MELRSPQRDFYGPEIHVYLGVFLQKKASLEKSTTWQSYSFFFEILSQEYK